MKKLLLAASVLLFCATAAWGMKPRDIIMFWGGSGYVSTLEMVDTLEMLDTLEMN